MTGGPARQMATQLGRRFADDARKAGLAGLQKFVESLTAGAPDDDNEEQAIYVLVAGAVGRGLDRNPQDVFRAVVELCGGPDHALAARLPAADPAVADEVRGWLLMVRLHYATPRSGPNVRTVEVTYRTATGELRQQELKQRLDDWADLPAPVRAERIRTGAVDVSFQIYPRST